MTRRLYAPLFVLAATAVVATGQTPANPATKAVEHKVAYLEKVGDVIVVCGAYKP